MTLNRPTLLSLVFHDRSAGNTAAMARGGSFHSAKMTRGTVIPTMSRSMLMATGIGHPDHANSVNATIQTGMTAVRFNIIDMVVNLTPELRGNFDLDVRGLGLLAER